MTAAAAPTSNTVTAAVPPPLESAAPAFATLGARYCGAADAQSVGLLRHGLFFGML